MMDLNILLSLLTLVFITIVILTTFLSSTFHTTEIPKVSIGYATLSKLRLSSICSKAYDKCRQKSYPLARFRLFFRSAVIISDPRLLNQLDFKHFQNRGSYYNSPSNLENLHLFNMKNEQWNDGRKALSKCFTLEKLKQALEVFDFYIQSILSEVNESVIYIFELCNKFSFLVASHMFLSHTPTRRALNLDRFNKLHNPGFWNKCVDVFGYICPSILRCFNVCDIPKDVLGHLKEILRTEIEKGDNCKKESFVHQLMRDDNISSREREQIIGMMIGLFVGSLKSTSSFLAYACYELAKATDLQEKLRSEVNAALAACQAENDDECLSSKHLREMRFMRRSLAETLRLHSGRPLLIRECTEAFTFSLPGDGNDSGTNDNFRIERKTLIFASLRRIFTDAKYFPEPLVFNPERFNIPINERTEHNNFLPFGLGKRICIGKKFVMLQAKVFNEFS